MSPAPTTANLSCCCALLRRSLLFRRPEDLSFKAWGVFNGDIWPCAGTYGSHGINSWAQNPTSEVEYSDQQGLDHYYWRHPGVKGAGYAPLLLDANWIDGWPLHTDTPPPTRDTFPHDSAPNMWRFCIDRHVGKIKGVFADGTKRKIGLKALWLIRWYREWPAVDLETIEWPEWMENVGEDF